MGLTLTYPNHTTQEAEIHLTVAPRKITFPASVNLARSQTVWVNASGDVPPWPEGGSIRAVPSSSAKGLISTEVDGPKVTVKADPQAPLGEHTVTLIVNLPGQQAIVREMTVNITPHEFFTFEECYEARPGALLNLDTIVLPEGAVMKVDAGSNKYLRVIQRPGRLEIQIAKTIPAGDHNVYFHITYPDQPETTKVFLLRVGENASKKRLRQKQLRRARRRPPLQRTRRSRRPRRRRTPRSRRSPRHRRRRVVRIHQHWKALSSPAPWYQQFRNIRDSPCSRHSARFH